MSADESAANGATPTPDDTSDDLTDLQRLFVDEYLVDLCAGPAYARAGGAAKSAYTIGPRLLKHAGVQALIRHRMAERERETRIRIYRVLEELAVVAFSDHTNYRVDGQGNIKLKKGVPRSAHGAISRVKRKVRTIPQGDEKKPIVEVEVEFALWSKPAALTDAMKKLGMFVERHELSGPSGGPIPVSTDDVRKRIASRVAGIAERGRANGHSGGTNGNGAHGP